MALLVATCLAAYLAALDNTVVAVALRDLQADLGAGVTGLQGVVTAYAVTVAALLLTGGALADRVGRRRTLLAGLATFASASAGCALAGDVRLLVAARVVQGAGAALVLPASLAVLAAAAPDPARRARAVAAWAASGASALVAGPLVGGLLVQAAGWRAVFWVNLPLCLLVAVLCRRGRDDPDPRRQLDLPGQAAATVTLGAATLAVVLAGRSGLSPGVALAGAVALTAAVTFLHLERHTTHPLLPPFLLRDRVFAGSLTAALAASLALFLPLVLVSLVFQLVQDRGALSAAVRLLPLTAAVVAGAPLAALLTRARGARLPVVAGLLLCAGGLALSARSLSGPALALEVGLALTGAGAGLTGTPVVTTALAVVSRSREGVAAGAVSVARELGGVVAVAGLGSLAVARLSADLLGRLDRLHVAAAPARALVALVLGGTTDPLAVLRATHGTVPLAALLSLRAAADASYLASTRLALGVAATVVAATALLSCFTLRDARSPRGRVPPAG